MDSRLAARIMDFHIDKQVVFVAGASRGIGRAIAATLLAEGACVILTGRNEESLRTACAEIENVQNHDRILALPGDLSDASVVESAIERAASHFGRVDHLIANLGSGSGELGWDLAPAEWDRLLNVNFFAPVRLAQAVLPRLLKNPGGGSILFITSIVALEATAAPLPYSAAKAALSNYSKNLARQLGSQKIRVNSIAPGNIAFPGGSWQHRFDKEPDRVNAMLRAEVPQQRFGTPAEVASLAAYLCSAQAAFCTGGSYVMDGGQTRRL